MKRRHEALLITLGVIAFCVLIVAFGIIKQGEIANKKNFIETWQKSTFTKRTNGSLATASDIANDRDRNCYNYNYIQVDADLSKAMPAEESFALRLSFTPCGDFGVRKQGIKQVAGIPLNWGLNITFESTHIAFDKGKVMGGTEVKVDFLNGDYNEYPFDWYSTAMVYVAGLYSQKVDATKEEDPDPLYVPVALKLSGTVQSWMAEFPLLEDFSYNDNGTRIYDGTLVGFQLVIKRSIFSKFFSVMVQIIMWVLPSLVAVIAIRNLLSGKPPEGPAVGMTMMLLFTLPGVRNTQPGVPPIGCTADAVSFLPSILICSFGVSLLLFNMSYKYYW